VKEGSPYLFSSAVCDLYQRLDQFLVLWLGSFFAQGLYAAAVPAASMLQVGATALSLFSFNSGSRQNPLMSRKQLISAGLTLAGFQAVTGLLFALVVGPLIVLFYGDRFAAAAPFALALIPAHAINGFTQVVEGRLRGLGNVRVGIVARIVGAAVMVAAVLLLFGKYRELSIPFAATLSNGLVALALIRYVLSRGHFELQEQELSGEGGVS
jgi:O-antigen/teichoic acid export membrane protein